MNHLSLLLAGALLAAAAPGHGTPGHGPPPMLAEAERAYQRSLATGMRLWRTNAPPLSSNGKSCTACHGAPASLTGVFSRYPRPDAPTGRVIPLEQQIALCIQQRMHGQPPPPGSAGSVALLVLLREQK